MPTIPDLSRLALIQPEPTGVKKIEKQQPSNKGETKLVSEITKTKSTKTSDQLPEGIDLFVLLLQNSPLRSAFGDETARSEDRETALKTILDALLKQRIVRQGRSELLLNLSTPDGSAVHLIDAFNEIGRGMPGVTPIAEGKWNSAHKVDLSQIRFADRSFADGFVRLVRANPVALRVSKFVRGMPQQPPVREALLELVLQSYMSQKGIGPKLYAAWWNPHSSDLTLDKLVKKKVGDVAQNICSMSELFQGDVQTFFKLKDNEFDSDMLYGNNGFWRAIGDCIVKACKFGVFHGDLKPANMLFRKTGPDKDGNYIYSMVYTDFDPFFVEILDMKNPEIKKMEMCIAMLSLHLLITFVRCDFEQEVKTLRRDAAVATALKDDAEAARLNATIAAYESFPWDKVLTMAIVGLAEAYNEVHEEEDHLKDAIESVCTLNTPTRKPARGQSAKDDDVPEIHMILTMMLNQWLDNYLRVKPGGGCKKIPGTLSSFEAFVEKVVKYARSGT